MRLSKLSTRARIEIAAGLVSAVAAVVGALAEAPAIFLVAGSAAVVAVVTQMGEARTSHIAELKHARRVEEKKAAKAEYEAKEMKAKDLELETLRQRIAVMENQENAAAHYSI